MTTFFSITRPALLGTLVAKLLNKKVVIHFGGDGVIDKLQTTWRGKVGLSIFKRFADGFIILNSSMKKEAIRVGLPPKRIHWLPCEVDTEEFSPVDDLVRNKQRES